MRRKQNRCCPTDFVENIQDFFSSHRIKGTGRFITNQQFGVGQQRLCNSKTLLHAAGIAADPFLNAIQTDKGK